MSARGTGRARSAANAWLAPTAASLLVFLASTPVRAQDPDALLDAVGPGQDLELESEERAAEATAPLEPAGQAGARRAERARGSSLPWYDTAVEELRDREADRQRIEDNYRRNIYAIQATFGRRILPDITEGYGGRLEFAMFFPEEDGASSLIVAVAGLSGWGSDDGWGFGVPAGFGWGFRTPALIGYFGPTVGIGVDNDAEPATPSFGGMGNLGFDVGGFRVMFDSRAEYRIMKLGRSRWHLTYGGLASVNL